MTNRKLAMPAYVIDLVTLPLRKLGLDPLPGEDLVTCSLLYEDGTELSVGIMCITQRRWFRDRAVIVVSLVGLDEATRAVTVHLRQVIPFPTTQHDVRFLIRISALVRAMAWAHAATGGMGECVDLPRQLSPS